jgi:hypothetical protein
MGWPDRTFVTTMAAPELPDLLAFSLAIVNPFGGQAIL